ncbi:hypothetical protein CK203_032339 [Vitis vinifera]|uniref:Uncharacterized protein n=1 Tax=Vitis vinifera TaxID=29760 RepID=A0A438IJT0_VITVI|nr:hypothetical protein CK203_032339 [Vitis vinifera]
MLVLKHGGGQVFKTLQCLVQSLDTESISVGAIVAEDESRASRHLRLCASERKIPMMLTLRKAPSSHREQAFLSFDQDHGSGASYFHGIQRRDMKFASFISCYQVTDSGHSIVKQCDDAALQIFSLPQDVYTSRWRSRQVFSNSLFTVVEEYSKYLRVSSPFKDTSTHKTLTSYSAVSQNQVPLPLNQSPLLTTNPRDCALLGG